MKQMTDVNTEELPDLGEKNGSQYNRKFELEIAKPS